MLSLVVRDTIFKTLHLLYTISKNSLWPLLHSLLIWVKTTQCTNIHVYIPCEQLKPKSHLPKLMDLWRIGECCCEPCAEKKKWKKGMSNLLLFLVWKTKYCFRVLLHSKSKETITKTVLHWCLWGLGGGRSTVWCHKQINKKQLHSRPCLQLPRIQSNTGTHPHQI